MAVEGVILSGIELVRVVVVVFIVVVGVGVVVVVLAEVVIETEITPIPTNNPQTTSPTPPFTPRLRAQNPKISTTLRRSR